MQRNRLKYIKFDKTRKGLDRKRIRGYGYMKSKMYEKRLWEREKSYEYREQAEE